jgi:hypothetical protein
VPNAKLQYYLENIGVTLAIIGGVLAAMQSIKSTYGILTSWLLPSTGELEAIYVLPSVLSASIGLLAGGLAIALIWFALLALRSQERKYGWRIIACAAAPFVLGIVVLIISALMLRSVSDETHERVFSNMAVGLASRELGGIFEYSSLALFGGVLILASTSRKVKQFVERQRTENPDQ